MIKFIFAVTVKDKPFYDQLLKLINKLLIELEYFFFNSNKLNWYNVFIKKELAYKVHNWIIFNQIKTFIFI
jgi:hypothetical protein